MSQEWNQQGGPGQQPARPFQSPPPGNVPPPPPPQQPKRNNTWIYVLIIALLLGINIYLFMNKQTVTQQKNDAIVQRDSAMTTRDAVNTEYQAAIARLDQLNTSNTQLNNEIKDKDGELQKLRNELQSTMSKSHKTADDYAKAKSLINQLNSKISGYQEKIAQLEGQNKDLTAQNSNLSQQRDSVATENSGLAEKVKLGAVLHASNIRLTALHLKHNGEKQKETEKARRTDLLRIIFDIDENRVAESGPKDIYLRISGPDGNLLSNAAFGSGTTTGNDGATINYTLVKQVALQQNQPVKDVVIDWNQQNDYAKGTYNIDIYNEGFKIGGGSVTLH